MRALLKPAMLATRTKVVESTSPSNPSRLHISLRKTGSNSRSGLSKQLTKDFLSPRRFVNLFSKQLPSLDFSPTLSSGACSILALCTYAELRLSYVFSTETGSGGSAQGPVAIGGEAGDVGYINEGPIIDLANSDEPQGSIKMAIVDVVQASVPSAP
ncbi:hypothetical protein BS47DRAFT_1402704 [Hydnum rufescens UP504]|uniref:Uncharacterized protein n=1 Tax=Hydnum rufescens UP504 TaxID=1448309 RepID=A0A9P6AD39_9AGAM|nr:hypothetical protein BS47DRAFT_1402704 [Hydnum rufescens UP504]